ncbi:MAG TPA: hypothetical protein VF210_11205 [Pseudomonadales bacterium]
MTELKISWQDRLLDVLEPVYKPRFDPRRPERVYRTFDLRRGFGRYTELCRAAFRRASEAAADTPLHRDGLVYLEVLSPARAAELLDAIRDGSETALVKGGKRPLEGLRLRDPSLRDLLLDAVLPAAVDRHLTGFFGSEYLVLWMTVTATPPSAEPPSVSFHWHCDKGPRTHLKLIVYLNATAEHGGNTEFLALPDSLAVARAGYPFGRVRERVGDLAELARPAARALDPVRREIEPGGGVIFQPATLLHRGVTPTRGTRYAVTLCLLPSPVPWREALARGAMLDLAAQPKWPGHADELLRALGWPGG